MTGEVRPDNFELSPTVNPEAEKSPADKAREIYNQQVADLAVSGIAVTREDLKFASKPAKDLARGAAKAGILIAGVKTLKNE